VADRQELHALLVGLRPQLDPEPYVYAQGPAPAGTLVFARIAEDEGETLVLTRAEADAAGLAVRWEAARITLRVHSDLEAVGLTAVVSSRLAAHGISCNAVAGYHHDHLFVPWDRGEQARDVLAEVSREAADT
jgi:uncharacterized protein